MSLSVCSKASCSSADRLWVSSTNHSNLQGPHHETWMINRAMLDVRAKVVTERDKSLLVCSKTIYESHPCQEVPKFPTYRMILTY